jgi:hypothetical protein
LRKREKQNFSGLFQKQQNLINGVLTHLVTNTWNNCSPGIQTAILEQMHIG